MSTTYRPFARSAMAMLDAVDRAYASRAGEAADVELDWLRRVMPGVAAEVDTGSEGSERRLFPRLDLPAP
ncbi:MAG TPA: hypothetical protein VFQ48_06845 [Pseudonocardiaceae bacterium]|nr:hypothetical protein [Pseudonocardiaceae bacterium]